LGSGDVLDNGALVFNRTGSVAVANAISGTGTVAHNGSGTTSLTGANTYSGGTNINNGTLLVNNSTGSATGSGAVNVNAGGTLGGGNPAGTTGFINAGANNITINANGTLAPGNSVGALTLTAANVIFAGTDASNLATYAVEISGATSDLLKITGVLDLNSLFDQISFAGAPDGTSTYALAQYSSVTGTFDNFPTLPAGYTLSYGATELDLTPVPEPATWVAGALMAIGIGVFSIRRHRRRAFVAR
jgi:autotransporter-associated beta strand protein